VKLVDILILLYCLGYAGLFFNVEVTPTFQLFYAMFTFLVLVRSVYHLWSGFPRPKESTDGYLMVRWATYALYTVLVVLVCYLLFGKNFGWGYSRIPEPYMPIFLVNALISLCSLTMMIMSMRSYRPSS
jgi:hypothetical protein